METTEKPAEAQAQGTPERKGRDGSARCRFCRDRSGTVDYKDVPILMRFLSSQGKVFSRRRSGVCAAHQRSLMNAIKRARFVGLVQYTG